MVPCTLILCCPRSLFLLGLITNAFCSGLRLCFCIIIKENSVSALTLVYLSVLCGFGASHVGFMRFLCMNVQ